MIHPANVREIERRIRSATDNYFAVSYKPELATTVDGSAGALPLPPGMSGSLVWNTRRVEFWRKGASWTPRDAQVTGMLCRWSRDDRCVLGTRVEVILDLLNRKVLPASS